MDFFVKYAYIIIIGMFALILILIYSERMLGIKDNSYNLIMNLVIVVLMAGIIISTLLNAYNIGNADPNVSTFVQIFNSLASKQMILFYGCVLYILFLSNTVQYNNNFSHPIFAKIGLGNWISNRMVAVALLFGTVFITAKNIHTSTIRSCGAIVEEQIPQTVENMMSIPTDVFYGAIGGPPTQ